jgi:hypothetical protein
LPASEALALPNRSEGLYFLCLRDRLVDALETRRPCAASRSSAETETAELYNEVQRVFTRIGGWRAAMQRSVIQNKGMQELLDMSEPVIRNHIAVMDSTFKLLAYTKNVETDDPMANELIRLGYHPEKTVEHFRLTHRLEQFQKADGIVVSDDYLTSKYVTVKKVFRRHDTYSHIVAMICCGRDYSEGLRDYITCCWKISRSMWSGIIWRGTNSGPSKPWSAICWTGRSRTPARRG